MRARAARMLVIGLVLALFAGCSDDKGDQGDEGADPSASASSGASASTTTEPAPSATPATGQDLRVRTLTVRLTDDNWVVANMGVSISASLRRGADAVVFNVSDIGAVTEDLDRNAASALDVESTKDLPLTRGENRTVQGVECFVIEGESAEKRHYGLGGVSQGYYFELSFEIPAGWEDADALIESMIASIEFNPDPGSVQVG